MASMLSVLEGGRSDFHDGIETESQQVSPNSAVFRCRQIIEKDRLQHRDLVLPSVPSKEERNRRSATASRWRGKRLVELLLAELGTLEKKLGQSARESTMARCKKLACADTDRLKEELNQRDLEQITSNPCLLSGKRRKKALQNRKYAALSRFKKQRVIHHLEQEIIRLEARCSPKPGAPSDAAPAICRVSTSELSITSAPLEEMESLHRAFSEPCVPHSLLLFEDTESAESLVSSPNALVSDDQQLLPDLRSSPKTRKVEHNEINTCFLQDLMVTSQPNECTDPQALSTYACDRYVSEAEQKESESCFAQGFLHAENEASRPAHIQEESSFGDLLCSRLSGDISDNLFHSMSDWKWSAP